MIQINKKNKGPWKVGLQIRGRAGGFPGWPVQLVVVGHFRGCRTPDNQKRINFPKQKDPIVSKDSYTKNSRIALKQSTKKRVRAQDLHFRYPSKTKTWGSFSTNTLLCYKSDK